MMSIVQFLIQTVRFGFRSVVFIGSFIFRGFLRLPRGSRISLSIGFFVSLLLLGACESLTRHNWPIANCGIANTTVRVTPLGDFRGM